MYKCKLLSYAYNGASKQWEKYKSMLELFPDDKIIKQLTVQAFNDCRIIEKMIKDETKHK